MSMTGGASEDITALEDGMRLALEALREAADADGRLEERPTGVLARTDLNKTQIRNLINALVHFNLLSEVRGWHVATRGDVTRRQARAWYYRRSLPISSS